MWSTLRLEIEYGIYSREKYYVIWKKNCFVLLLSSNNYGKRLILLACLQICFYLQNVTSTDFYVIFFKY